MYVPTNGLSFFRRAEKATLYCSPFKSLSRHFSLLHGMLSTTEKSLFHAIFKQPRKVVGHVWRNVQPELHSTVQTTMAENDAKIRKEFSPGTFQRLFWEQQLKAFKYKSPIGMRWHPIMIKWALQLKMLSSSSNHSLRTAGFITITMPSERTLRDYSHFFKN